MAQFTKALTVADELLGKVTDEDIICDILCAKGTILYHDLNRSSDAAECFLAVKNNYPKNALLSVALTELSNMELIQEDKKQTAVEVEEIEFSSSNYPNPFNPATQITYTLPSDEHVTIKVFDVLGSEISTLVNEHQKLGAHSISFDGSNLSSGIYFYTVTAGNNHITKKMILTK